MKLQLFRRMTLSVFFALTTILLSAQTALQHSLEVLPEVRKVQKLESPNFSEKYVCYVEQPLDHKYPEAGTFTQRVFVMHAGNDKPTVMVTEGYGAGYAAHPRYQDEVARLLNANVVFVEHRYFLESTPTEVDWKYLTAENSAYDLHHVNQLMKTIYAGKWISTGVSKGGQTAMIYRTFFPNDVDISVPYVAPLCRAVEDGRHEPFLRNFVGTPEDRAAILAFQREILHRRDRLTPLFESYIAKNKNLKFNIPLSEVYDYSVLEYSFAFWQWGTPVTSIPNSKASDQELFHHWMKISDPSYFAAESDNTSFFIQAAKELGYYGYDIKPFKEELVIKSSENYLARLFLPEGGKVKFDNALYKKIKAFVKTTDAKIMFIYGEYDPWTAPAVVNPHKENIVYLVDPHGSHRSRIGTMPQEMQEQAKETLTKWLLEQ